MDKARAEQKRRKTAITRRIKREVLSEYGLDTLPEQGERDLITGAQGTGKSRAVAEGIAAMTGEVVIWWLVPTLKKAAEQALEYDRLAGPDSLQSVVVRGRGAPRPNAKDQIMCPRHQVVNRAASMGVEVQRVICWTCPLRDECGFQAQLAALKDVESGLFLMASDYLWLPCPAPNHDILVVDESVLNKATEIVSFEPSRITEDHKWAGAGDLAEAMERRRIAVLVRDAVTKHGGRELAYLRDEGVTANDIRACVKHLATREEARPDVDGKMTDEEIAARLDAVEAREILKVLKLFRQIRCEVDLPRDRLNSVWFDPEARVRVGKEIERAERVFVGRVRKPRVADETPVLVLDGTGSIELYRTLFGERMRLHRFAPPRDAQVTQTTVKGFSRQSLTGRDRNGNPISNQKVKEVERLRSRIIDLLRLLPGKILLVTYQAVEDLLVDQVPPHVGTAHFGALRGINAFERCEIVVILGREQPSAQAIEAMTRPFTATDPESFIPIGEYVLQSRGRRMRNGGPNVVEVHGHPDPRCQVMLEQVREAEIAQAIDRVRPVFNRRRIILLTNLPLDVTVDQVVPWKDLRPARFAIAYARGGVLPLSASELARCFPDLWRTPKAAEHALHRSRLNTPKTQMDTPFGFWGYLLAAPRSAVYRRKGQRGCPTQVLISPNVPNPRQAVEKLVGKLTEFRLERSPPPADALPPLAAALSAEAHLLATCPPDGRPPDRLGFAGVMKLMPQVNSAARALCA
jgi:hypothetical protein